MATPTIEIPEDMELVYERPKSLRETHFHYCPGCTHGTTHRLVAEVLDELDVRERTVAVAPVGCAVLAYNYFNLDMAEAPHGRAPALATGIKRVSPDKIVWTYQGDGDLAAIGTAETVQAANRGENITIVFVNNGIYGMTGGQMAPTTLPGGVTTSSPTGRDVAAAGHPMKVAELLAALPGVAYVTRQGALDHKQIRKAKKALKLAFRCQMEGLGFALVEILNTCPTNWRMPPDKALAWAQENMVPYYPLGDTKMTPEVEALAATL
jgi:2-oxoglutarate ferredoxin oxidoreductase subunit beta